jgi:hypothetical protein
MMEKYPLDTLDEFLDLALNRLIPQSVGLLVSRIPAFRNAPAGSFSSGIGLSISTSISNDTFAIAGIQPNGEYSIRMQITLYLEKWLEKTGDGGYVLRRDGQTAAELNHVIIHELFHCFMFDYNRNGEVFFRPASYSYDDPESVKLIIEKGTNALWHNRLQIFLLSPNG